MALNFDKAKKAVAVAIARGTGEFKNKILYLHKDDVVGKESKPKILYNENEHGKFLKQMNIKSKDKKNVVTELQKALKDDKYTTIDKRIEKLKDTIEKTEVNTIDIGYEAKFELLPNPNGKDRSIWYIGGASGAGKSYIAKSISENYLKLFPERKIYLVSSLTEDKTLDSMKPTKPLRIDHNTFVEDPINIKELKNSLIIFDDVDVIAPKKLNLAVFNLIDHIAMEGRHHNISLIFITHFTGGNFRSTRLILQETHNYIVFPKATSYHQLRYLLETHVGMQTKEIRDLRKMHTRWVCIGKDYPGYLITEHIAKLLHGD